MGIFLNKINSIQFVMFLCARNCQNVHKIEIKLSKQRILTGGHKNMNNLCIREFITIREFIITRRDHPKRWNVWNFFSVYLDGIYCHGDNLYATGQSVLIKIWKVDVFLSKYCNIANILLQYFIYNFRTLEMVPNLKCSKTPERQRWIFSITTLQTSSLIRFNNWSSRKNLWINPTTNCPAPH